jgi:Asp-tRNA(Asn)/Glu-tRNA(Gln) amidotransferase A subunit family amidase
MAGIESTSGSHARKGFVPTETMAGIERLEASGAIVFARTTVPEFCYLGITESDPFGRTSNPWNLARTAGGSSGGAAAAVAAGCGPLSLGGDGGGSIRIPAAFCGIVGFKPTFGLVPHEPSTAGWKTLVAVGPMARTVADVRLMLAAVAGFNRRDRHSLPPVQLDVPAPPPADLRVVVSEDLAGHARRQGLVLAQALRVLRPQPCARPATEPARVPRPGRWIRMSTDTTPTR